MFALCSLLMLHQRFGPHLCPINPFKLLNPERFLYAYLFKLIFNIEHRKYGACLKSQDLFHTVIVR